VKEALHQRYATAFENNKTLYCIHIVCLTNYCGNFVIKLLLGFWVMKKAEYAPSQGTRGSFCSSHKQIPHKL